nr:transcription initiation factor iif subunit beta [Quercus suber]
MEIKPEIKVDPVAGSSTAMADIEEFEDDIDLQIPTEGGQAWLVKLPRDVWQVWNDMYGDQPEDQPVEIGKLRVFNEKEGDDPLKRKIQIRLLDVPSHADLPKNYDVKLTANGYNNTVVFSEKDLPGHRAPRFNRHNRHLNKPAGTPTGILTKQERYGNRTGYKSAIPKQTALAPMVHHECLAAPIEDDAYFAHLSRRWEASAHPQARVQYNTGIDRSMHPGISSLSVFNTASRSTGLKKKGPPKEKAVRMEREDLIDAIFKCFTQWRYWPLKSLTQHLHQPTEAVKSVLDDVALQIRAGDFNNTWQLKPEFATMAEAKHGNADIKDEAAEVRDDGSEDDDDESALEDEDEFEDVKMGGS